MDQTNEELSAQQKNHLLEITEDYTPHYELNGHVNNYLSEEYIHISALSPVFKRFSSESQSEISFRRWSNILSAASGSVFVWNRKEAENNIISDVNPVVYGAYRDINPSRKGPVFNRFHENGFDGHSDWKIDLVVYCNGLFPTGELYRSVGHWNPLDEWEVFQVYRGEAAIMCANLRQDKTWNIEVKICREGDGCVIKPGTWHLTYPLSGKPIIVNIYSSPSNNSEANRPLYPAKYETRSHGGPDFAILHRQNRIQAVLLDDSKEINIPFRQPTPEPFLKFVRDSDYKWLAEWFSYSGKDEFEEAIKRLCSSN